MSQESVTQDVEMTAGSMRKRGVSAAVAPAIGILLPLLWLNRLNQYGLEIGGVLIGSDMLAMLLLFYIGALGQFRLGRLTFNKKITWVALLLVSWAIMTVLYNAQGLAQLAKGFNGILYLVTPLAGAAGLTMIMSRRLRFVQLYYIIWTCGIALALLAIVTSVAPSAFSFIVDSYKTAQESGRSFSPMGGPSATSMVLLVTGFFGLSTLGIRQYKRTSLFLSVLCLLGVLSTISRAPILVGIICTGLYFFRGSGRADRKLVRLLSIVAISALGILWLRTELDLQRLEGLGIASSQDDGSASIRRSSQIAAASYFLQRPFFGGGLGIVYDTPRMIRNGVEYESVMMLNGRLSAGKPHSLYWLVATEMGVIGILLTCTFIIVLFILFRGPDPVLRGYRYSLLTVIGMSFFQDHLLIIPKLAFWIYAYFGLGLAYFRITRMKTVNAKHIS